MSKFNTLKLYSVIILFVCFCNATYSQTPTFLDSSYTIVFEDEFTGTTLDQNKWLRRFGWGPGYSDTNIVLINQSPCGVPPNTYGNIAYREYNYNDTNVLKINGGTAKILVKKQNVIGETWNFESCPSPNCLFYTNNNCNSGLCFYTLPMPYKYVTTMLNSRQKFKYGYFEIKFRLPPFPTTPSTFNGMGPNFWLFGADPSSNNNWSEIDIFEIHSADNQLTDNIIYQSSLSANFGQPYSQGTPIGNFTDNVWHTAGALWTNNTIEFYFDGLKINQLNNPNIKVDSLVPMPMIVDINTTFTGAGYNWCDTIGSKTSLPYTYEIDYVRVWQQQEACDTTKIYCSNLNPSTYKSKIYNSVSVGGSGCNDPISSTNNMAILGSAFVEVKEGFSIDANSKVLLNVQPCIGSSVGLKVLPGSDIIPPPASFKKHYQ